MLASCWTAPKWYSFCDASGLSRHGTSGVTIGRARRAVHAGPALWGGAQNFPYAVFLKFFGGRGGPFGILTRGPTATLLRHCTERSQNADFSIFIHRVILTARARGVCPNLARKWR